MTGPAGKYGCTARAKQTGQICNGKAIRGTDRCRTHSGMSVAKAKAKGQVVAELAKWGLSGQDTTRDPGEVLLRLVTQSAARCDLYANLLQQAYDAAERLKAAQDAGWDTDQNDVKRVTVGNQMTAREDLRRVFATGGVSALIGNTYDATKDGDIYVTGEAIRGLAKLEADERDRCAGFAAKAVAAGLAERQVRLAEQQGALLAGAVRTILDRLNLTEEQQQMVPTVVPTVLRGLTGGAA